MSELITGITGLMQAVEALSLGERQGRPYLTAIAVISVAFGVLILARPPQDLMTLAVHITAFGLLLGVLRLIVPAGPARFGASP